MILKPASDTVLIAYELCQCFWRAGVPRTALQFAPCSGGNASGSSSCRTTASTPSSSPAAPRPPPRCSPRKPTMHLLAETGGKNATIVTALADRDQAIKNVLHSAFSHSGQKCSATSLLILEERSLSRPASSASRLCDAVESLRVGSAWELLDEDRAR